jgi:RNA polymerase sigma factor (sigma-70 family)
MATQPSEKISVFILNHHSLFRAGIRANLEKIPDIFVVGDEENDNNARELIGKLSPDIVLIGVTTPGFSFSAFLNWIKTKRPETTCLILAAHDRGAHLARAMDDGAVGYLDEEMQARRLVESIRRAARREALFDDQQRRRAHEWHECIEKKWDSLSEREQQTLRLLADGKNNKEISSSLCISESTVEKHLEKIYRKLDVSSRAQAICWGIENCVDFPY